MALLLAGASPRVFTSISTHSHDCYEIIMNTEGEGVAEIGGKEYPFSPGTVHVIPPNTPHAKRAEAGFRDIYLHTDSLFAAPLSRQERPADTEPFLCSDDASHTMESLFSILLARYLLNPCADEISETLFSAVLQLIGERRRLAPADPVVSALVHTIAASYGDPEFQVTGALSATGYSKDHLRRRFRQVTGMTPNAYLKDVRMRYAKKLLRQRETLQLSIRHVAFMCGYYDPAYFCRSFRQATGMTPSEYLSTGLEAEAE